MLRALTGGRRGSEPGPSSGGTRILTLIHRSPVARRGFFFVRAQQAALARISHQAASRRQKSSWFQEVDRDANDRAGCRLRWPCPRGSFGPVHAHAPSTVGPAMLSVASTRTGPKSSAIITAPGEKCGLASWVTMTLKFPKALGLEKTLVRRGCAASMTPRCWFFGTKSDPPNINPFVTRHTSAARCLDGPASGPHRPTTSRLGTALRAVLRRELLARISHQWPR